jgi:7-carboxy-7-deazaguanine synthase
MTIREIVEAVGRFSSRHLCLTGGEPLLYGDHSLALIEALLGIESSPLTDLHIETNGAIDLTMFLERIKDQRVRYIMDFKLPESGETEQMVLANLAKLRPQDELKFVIAGEADFHYAVKLLKEHQIEALALFSPVWETMPPRKLVELMLQHGLAHVKLNLQLHKIIWDPAMRGV